MNYYSKKSLLAKDVNELCTKYGISQLEASILLRRGIKSGEDIKYFIEKDLRFSHQTFNFSNMEDAVERINQAEEEGEKVLIFGDKDVDGVTSTAILYEYLKSRNIDVSWRLPVGEDAYGLSMEAVDDFAKDYGSLIITVDCGISNNAEIAHANELGIDVIVTDHHNPPEKLPDAIVIIDPKTKDSGYPFMDISGAAVAYKLVSALRFSRMDIYGQDICLLSTKKEEGKITLELLKSRNLVKKDYLKVEFDSYPLSIYQTKIADFLKGEMILVWNKEKEENTLKELFGKGVEFELMDMRKEISKKYPSLSNVELSTLREKSAIAKYSDIEISELEVFMNIFITFIEKKQEEFFPSLKKESEMDLQLVALAALADIMPLRNENRIFIKNALEKMNQGIIRDGLKELLARSNLVNKEITSTDLSWTIVPVLNAAGRLGKSYLALSLLLSKDPQERAALSDQILELNEERKRLVSQGEELTFRQAEESFKNFDEKLCVVIDKKICKGVTGIIAGNIMKKYSVPSIAITFSEDGSTAVGSMRSCRSLKSTKFLELFGENFFKNFGGHDAAAGFSFEAGKINDFLAKAKKIAQGINLESENSTIDVDAELSTDYLGPEILETIDFFEPYGEANPKLLFITKSIQIKDASICGKSERQHLKLLFDCKNCKFPAMFWGEAERLNRDFSKGDRINIVYNINKNYFNGSVTPQMILQETPLTF